MLFNTLLEGPALGLQEMEIKWDLDVNQAILFVLIKLGALQAMARFHALVPY